MKRNTEINFSRRITARSPKENNFSSKAVVLSRLTSTSLHKSGSTVSIFNSSLGKMGKINTIRLGGGRDEGSS